MLKKNCEHLNFVSSNTTGNIDSYKFPAMPFTSGTIGSSMATTIARKDDVGPKTLAITARQSSTDYVGSNSSYPLSSYLAYSQRYDINDPSGSAWTLANVNAIEYGIKEVL